MSLGVLWALGGLRRRSGVRWWCWVWTRGGGRRATAEVCQTHLRLDCQRTRQDDVRAQAGPSLSVFPRRHCRRDAIRENYCTHSLAGLCVEGKGSRRNPSPTGVGQACSCRQIPTQIREMPRRPRVDVFLVQHSRDFNSLVKLPSWPSG